MVDIKNLTLDNLIYLYYSLMICYVCGCRTTDCPTYRPSPNHFRTVKDGRGKLVGYQSLHQLDP